MPQKRSRGAGTIYRTESGRWRVRVTKGRKADGRKRTVSRTVDTREEAEAECIRLYEFAPRDTVGAPTCGYTFSRPENRPILTYTARGVETCRAPP